MVFFWVCHICPCHNFISFLVGMCFLVREFGMLELLRVVFGIYWVFHCYFLDEILSFWGWILLDYLCMPDYGWLRMVPVYNLVFFHLINSFIIWGLSTQWIFKSYFVMTIIIISCHFTCV